MRRIDKSLDFTAFDEKYPTNENVWIKFIKCDGKIDINALVAITMRLGRLSHINTNAVTAVIKRQLRLVRFSIEHIYLCCNGLRRFII